MNEEIEWDVDPSKVRIRPLPEPNREDIASIPLGSEVLLIDMSGEGVSFSGQDWGLADQLGYLALLADDEVRLEGIALFYVAPSFEGELLSEDEVIKSAMIEHIGGGPEAFVEPPEELAVVLRLIVRKAREGMVVNPF